MVVPLKCRAQRTPPTWRVSWTTWLRHADSFMRTWTTTKRRCKSSGAKRKRLRTFSQWSARTHARRWPTNFTACRRRSLVITASWGPSPCASTSRWAISRLRRQPWRRRSSGWPSVSKSSKTPLARTLMMIEQFKERIDSELIDAEPKINNKQV